MAKELIRPIDADTAHAIEEAAKASGKAIDAAVRSGAYVGNMLGDLPHDLVGILGDWLKHKRMRRWIELQAETERILKRRGITNREEVSPSVAIPLIDAAINEDREMLKDLWAKLLAAALDPDRSKQVRPSLIDLLKQLDPVDARVLQYMHEPNDRSGRYSDLADALIADLNVDRVEAFYSMEHLHSLGCLHPQPSQVPRPRATAKATLLIRAVSD